MAIKKQKRKQIKQKIQKMRKRPLKKAVKQKIKQKKKLKITMPKVEKKFKDLYKQNKNVSAKFAYAEKARQAIAEFVPVQTGFTPINSDMKDRYISTITKAIAENRLKDNTRNKISEIVFGARHQLRNSFSAKLEFMESDGSRMGYVELFGVLAENARTAFEEMIGHYYTSRQLEREIKLKAGWLHDEGQLTRAGEPQGCREGFLKDIRMNYTIA